MPPTTPTLAERILAHLTKYPVDPHARDVPREVTQEGIAEALGARVAHVSRALKALIADGLVTAHLAHPRGSRRRSRAHSLTDEGHRRGRAVLVAAPDAVEPRAPAPPAAHAHNGPPAGRHAEFDALVAVLEESAKGDGPLVALLEGDSGSGKTRLLDAFRAEAERRGARVLGSRAVPVGGEQLVGPIGPALAPIGFESRYRARAAGTPRERALAAATEALAAAARERPVVVALDDLHLAGPDVATFLHGLVLALPHGARVLFAVSFRREEAWELPNGALYAALAPLRALPRARLVTLGPLDRDGLAELLEDAGAHHVEDALLERVARESGGNPLYALAMADALADGVDEEDFFPKIVAQAATERFSTLPSDVLAALQLAAVAGAEFEYETLARAHEGDEEELVHALDVLIDRLILEETPTDDRSAPRMRFEHPKVREAVLADISATRRRYLETRVAAARALPAE